MFLFNRTMSKCICEKFSDNPLNLTIAKRLISYLLLYEIMGGAHLLNNLALLLNMDTQRIIIKELIQDEGGTQFIKIIRIDISSGAKEYCIGSAVNNKYCVQN